MFACIGDIGAALHIGQLSEAESLAIAGRTEAVDDDAGLTGVKAFADALL